MRLKTFFSSAPHVVRDACPVVSGEAPWITDCWFAWMFPDGQPHSDVGGFPVVAQWQL